MQRLEEKSRGMHFLMFLLLRLPAPTRRRPLTGGAEALADGTETLETAARDWEILEIWFGGRAEGLALLFYFCLRAL